MRSWLAINLSLALLSVTAACSSEAQPSHAGVRPSILERLVFMHKSREVFLVADAYRGREIRQSIADFLSFAAGRSPVPIAATIDGTEMAISAGGNSDLIVFVGHNGLMDFNLDEQPQGSDSRRRDCMILACASKQYFARPVRHAGADPVLWTTGLMAPEAYVLSAAIDGWILNEDGERVRKRAAEAYNSYQKCGLKAALNLFASG